VLVESSWHYTKPPRVSAKLKRRQQGLSQEVKDISKKAQHRLFRRYWRLTNQGKVASKAVTAVARELCGFIWDIGVRTAREHRAATEHGGRQAA